MKRYVFVTRGSGGPMFAAHRPGCRDIAKEIRNSSDPSRRKEADWPVIEAASPEEAARKLAEDLYCGEAEVLVSDVSFKNCTKE